MKKRVGQKKLRARARQARDARLHNSRAREVVLEAAIPLKVFSFSLFEEGIPVGLCVELGEGRGQHCRN
jgi:hypothetical protein